MSFTRVEGWPGEAPQDCGQVQAKSTPRLTLAANKNVKLWVNLELETNDKKLTLSYFHFQEIVAPAPSGH